jgi:hypothetical protein
MMSETRSRSGGIVIDTGQAEVEILAILPRGDRRFQIAVRRRDDADVDLDRHRAADAIEVLLFQRAQDLRLKRQGQIADLVEKQGAAMRELELPELAPGGAGERALLVSEELGLEQVLGNRGG